jgi:hypothetical protein
MGTVACSGLTMVRPTRGTGITTPGTEWRCTLQLFLALSLSLSDQFFPSGMVRVCARTRTVGCSGGPTTKTLSTVWYELFADVLA